MKHDTIYTIISFLILFLKLFGGFTTSRVRDRHNDELRRDERDETS